ncbi:hypothetical protein CON22_17960 [Bacillus cereus]|nr:hypothetical protein CON22_17960 [Bacillus cereus]
MVNKKILKTNQLVGTKINFSHFLEATDISVGKHCVLQVFNVNGTCLKEINGKIIGISFLTDCCLLLNINGLTGIVNGIADMVKNGCCYSVLNENNTYTTVTLKKNIGRS